MPRIETCVLCHGRMNGPTFADLSDKIELYSCPMGHNVAGFTSEE